MGRSFISPTDTKVSDEPSPAKGKAAKEKKDKSVKANSSKKRKSADITDAIPSSSKSKIKKDKSSKNKDRTSPFEDPSAVETAVLPTPMEEYNNEDGPDGEKLPTVPETQGHTGDSADPPSKKRKLSVEEIEVDITAPEPPSKKALRLLKKGKPLPPSKSGAEPTPETVAKKAEIEKRSEHGVWIGNLPWSVSKEDLRKFLVEYSDLTEEAITRVHMPGPNDNKSANKVEERKFGKVVHNKGFAYVDFSSAKDVETAIELSEQLLGGRRVLIKDNKSFEGRPLKTKEESRAEGKPPNKRVFLGNLRFDATEESIKEHFEKCGSIESVKVATFEDSGKCKGYAWVVFEDLEAAGFAVRGYVMVEEEDSAAESEDESESDEEEAFSKLKPKKTKMKKWWLNKIMGRPLKIEYAEGAQVRYKKRYGKDGTKNAGAVGDASGEDVRENKGPTQTFKSKAAAVKYDLPYGGAHLTGGIVEATGKKTTF